MFSARRKPKRIARDEADSNTNEEEGKPTQIPSTTSAFKSNITPPSWPKSTDSTAEDSSGPIVRRPTTATNKPKSKLRTSFAPDSAEESSDTPAATKPKPKSKPRLNASLSTQSLPRFIAVEDTTTRPSYTKSALEQLRNSTPSTPKDLTLSDDPTAEQAIQNLDLTSKFGPAPSNTSQIPSASEIAEKKSRRARLAQEHSATQSADFISLDDDNLSDNEFQLPRRLQVSTYVRDDAGEKDTRLVREDEDVLEGFESYTEDAETKRITMGREARMRAQRRDRETMREMIEDAEGDGSEDDTESDSETERNYAYERAQTRHGMDGLVGVKEARKRAGAERPRQPREVTPVPKLVVALAGLRERIARVEIERVKIERRREEVKRERTEIVASQDHIQRSLTEAGEELERITRDQLEVKEMGMATGLSGRGLSSMGLTPEPT